MARLALATCAAILFIRSSTALLIADIIIPSLFLVSTSYLGLPGAAAAAIEPLDEPDWPSITAQEYTDTPLPNLGLALTGNDVNKVSSEIYRSKNRMKRSANVEDDDFFLDDDFMEDYREMEKNDDIPGKIVVHDKTMDQLRTDIKDDLELVAQDMFSSLSLYLGLRPTDLSDILMNEPGAITVPDAIDKIADHLSLPYFARSALHAIFSSY